MSDIGEQIERGGVSPEWSDGSFVESMYRIAQQQARPKWNGAGNHTADLTDAEIVEVKP